MCKSFVSFVRMKMQPTIIFEDNDLIIVNKPANYLTIPARFKKELPSVYSWLQQDREDVYIVHRLDRETSGILCFAKNETSHKVLSKQFQDRIVEKLYLALVDGIPAQGEGTIDKPIAENMAQRGKMIIAKRGKASLTTYKVVEKFKSFSLVEAQIHTGRTHQVRVHLQSIGHPLAVDFLYGKREGFYLSELKGRKYHSGKEEDERPLMTRSTLHAAKLVLNHPTTDQPMVFEAPLPNDFAVVMKQLRRWGS
jgi:23S rRNA pseudouridine1911/1915/1917 synthase